MDWLPPVVNLGSSIVVAIVTSMLTVRLALKRFYSEKWWERKSAAYTAIIEGLHHIREHADTNLVFSLRGKDLPPEGEKELTQELQEAMAQLRKHRDLGSFVASDEAISLLNQLFSELDASTNTPHWQKHLEMKLAAVDKCLSGMRSVARNDLKLK